MKQAGQLCTGSIGNLMTMVEDCGCKTMYISRSQKGDTLIQVHINEIIPDVSSFLILKKRRSRIAVCQTMFLRTLGHKSDEVLRTVQNTNDEANIVPMSKRGKHQPKHRISENDEAYIRMHIKKFNPCVSHYRSEHAPNRWYLPSELSCTKMSEDYQICCEEENRKAFSYIKYWQIIK